VTAPTYTVDRIVDLLAVPSEHRARCVKELLIGLEFSELAGAEIQGPLTWTDDGDMSCSLYGPDGKPQLSLKVTR
jgi:hypothetical protein